MMIASTFLIKKVEGGREKIGDVDILPPSQGSLYSINRDSRIGNR